MKEVSLHKTHLTSAPIRRHHRTASQTEVPFTHDQVRLGRQPESAAPETPQKKKGLTGRLIKGSVLTTLSAAQGIAAVGGLVALSNADVIREALRSDQLVTVVGTEESPQTEPQSFAEVMNQTLSFEQAPSTIQVSQGEHHLEARLGLEDAKALVNGAHRTDFVRGQVAEQLAKAESTVNQRLQNLEVPAGEVLLNVRTPLPTGSRSLIQLGDFDLPTGLKSLQMEDIPLVAGYEVNPVTTGLQVSMTPVEVDRAPLPPNAEHSLHLGAVRAEVKHPSECKIPVSGRIKVRLDDGSATRRALEEATDPQVKAELEARLVRIEQVKSQGLGSLLGSDAQAELEFAGCLESPQSRMADGLIHVWLSPDHDQDQRADIRLTGDLHTASLDALQLRLDKVQLVQDQQQLSAMAGFVSGQVNSALEGVTKKMAPLLMDGVRDTVKDEIDRRFGEELKEVENELDADFDKTLDQAQLGLAGGGLRLESLDIDGKSQQLVARVHSDKAVSELVAPKIHQGEQSSPAPSGRLVRIKTTEAQHLKSSQSQVIIPGSTAREFFGNLIQSPNVRAAFATLTDSAKKEVEANVSRVEGPSGRLGLDLEVPFPTQQTLETPFGELPTLGQKKIPLTADYRVQDLAVDLNLSIEPVEVKEAVQPPEAEKAGVFLGALRVKNGALSTPVAGSVHLQKGKTSGGAAWAEEALEEALGDQRFDFKGQVATGEMETLFYLWAVPDQNGDHKPDIAVAHRAIKTGAEGFSAQLDSVSARQGKNDSALKRAMGEVIKEQMKDSAESLTGTLSSMFSRQLEERLREGDGLLAGEVNGELMKLYPQYEKVEVPLPGGRQYSMGLGSIQVGQDHFVANYTAPGFKAESNGSLDAQVAPGQIGVQIPGGLLEKLLVDSSEGGPMDWNALLAEAAKDSSAIKELRLAQDENGRVISPKLEYQNGKPVISMKLSGDSNGVATPVSGVARLLPGALGRGAGWLMDNTVGEVLGGRVHTEVRVPLNFRVAGGKLDIAPGDVEFRTPDELGDFDLIDILPTRLLSSVIVDGVGKLMGPAMVDEALEQNGINKEVSELTDLSSFGLEWTDVQVNGRDGGKPDIVVSFGVKRGLSKELEQKAVEFCRQAATRSP